MIIWKFKPSAEFVICSYARNVNATLQHATDLVLPPISASPVSQHVSRDHVMLMSWTDKVHVNLYMWFITFCTGGGQMCNEHNNGGLFWGVHRAAGHAHLHQAHHRSCHVGPHHVNQWSPDWHGGKFNRLSVQMQTLSPFIYSIKCLFLGLNAFDARVCFGSQG